MFMNLFALILKFGLNVFLDLKVILSIIIFFDKDIL